jgi:tetratricopeptide (TPR) repeat protein
MQTHSLEEVAPKPAEAPAMPRAEPRRVTVEPASWAGWMTDVLLIGLFLALAFLLGVFPLKDTDFYWHLRTGDWIRQNGRVPRFDLFTFTRAGEPWIDLHWLFQIAISWLHQRGGVVALNLAKCIVTCVALLILVTARKREWPVWAVVLAWLPALFVLSGRIYVRPETLTLLYLSIFLAVILRWDRSPRLVLALPPVQVLWVNSHGLFVLGPIILVFGLVDAAIRFGFFARDRRKWWRTILGGTALTAAACLVNPYFVTGALYPLELAGTMRNPIFARNIAELMSVPDFIRRVGLWNVPLLIHLATIMVGALSFLVPLYWLLRNRRADRRPSVNGNSLPADHEAQAGPASPTRRAKRSRARRVRTDEPRTADGARAAQAYDGDWHASPFRLLLFATFCILSMQATRNSHQFAAVLGTVTAWNFGEWAAAVRRHRARAQGDRTLPSTRPGPRLFVLGTLVVLVICVGSGGFFRLTGEGRTVGLGEEPFFFPHEAAKVAGNQGMPDRCLAFHNGNASVYEYYHGPERKVYTDPRLEVAGADLFKRYLELQDRISKDAPGWEAELAEMGRPVILNDHEYNWTIGAVLLTSPHWRCVWFDPIAAVFVHDSYQSASRERTVDFAARHFRPVPSAGTPGDIAEWRVLSLAFRKYVMALSSVPNDHTSQLAWLGLDAARRLIGRVPDSSEAWKNLGVIELRRSPPAPPSQRYRLPFDPVFDLSIVRATFALRRAAELASDDFTTLAELKTAFDQRRMFEPALESLERLLSLRPKNQLQGTVQAELRGTRVEYLSKLGEPPARSWKNVNELDQIVTAQLAAGRVVGAAVLLEQANPPAAAPWDLVDRIATLRLHLGEPAQARALWTTAVPPAKQGLQAARIGTTYLVEGDFNQARRQYREALAIDPELFEAAYCLAVLEQDDGDAAAAFDQASVALETAKDETGRSAARSILSNVSRFARPRDQAR